MVARSAFAAVAVLFAMSHCAIDDRELEEHGADDDSSGGTSNGGTSGGGTGGSDVPVDCQPQGNESECFACEMVNCCDEIVACYDSLDCDYFLDCFEYCEDQACLDVCASYFPEGAELFFDFYYCGQDSCAACSAG